MDYSRFTQEASMVVEKLPEVVPPSGRVLGRGLLVLPILEARRRRNRGEIAKKGMIKSVWMVINIIAISHKTGMYKTCDAPKINL